MEGLEKAWSSGMRDISSSISRSMSRRNWGMEDVFVGSSRRSYVVDEDEDEDALVWAALEKLPTYDHSSEVHFYETTPEDQRFTRIKITSRVKPFTTLQILSDPTCGASKSFPTQPVVVTVGTVTFSAGLYWAYRTFRPRPPVATTPPRMEFPVFRELRTILEGSDEGTD